MLDRHARSGVLTRRGLPRPVFDSWVESLDRTGEPQDKILAWARVLLEGAPPERTSASDADRGAGVDGVGAVAIGSRGRLSVPTLDMPDVSDTPDRTESPDSPGTPDTFRNDQQVGQRLEHQRLEHQRLGHQRLGWQHLGWHRIEHGSWNSETRRLSWRLYGGRRGDVVLDEPGRLPELFRERIAASVAVEEQLDTGSGTLTVSGRRDLARPERPIEWQTSLGRGLSWRRPGLQQFAEEMLARLRAEYDER